MSGAVRVEGVALRWLPIMMPESAFRMLRHGEFEVSEMSLSWYTRTVFSDPRPFIAIPVFPSRMFRHSSIYINLKSGITEPADLVGKRIGCPEYQMTAAVWIKGILADQYDVPVDSVTYFTGGLEEAGRRETPLDLPAGIDVVPIDDRQTLSSMLDEGEIDAVYTAHAPSPFAEGSPNVDRLFRDYEEVERTYFRDTGVFPIMHVIVVRQDIYEENPWVITSLMKGFEEAKAAAYAGLNETTALKVMLPWLISHVEDARAELGSSDYWPYGIDSNEKVLDTFLRYSWEQGLSPDRLQAKDLFAPEAFDRSRI